MTTPSAAPEVRPMYDDELNAVTELWRRSRRSAMPELEERLPHTAEEDLAYFSGTIARENEIWVACSGGEVLGMMAIRDGFIDRMYIDPDQQRRGIGTALLEHARKLSPGRLELFTHQANHGARAFYEKHGFEAVSFGVSPDPESEPDVRYQWRPLQSDGLTSER